MPSTTAHSCKQIKLCKNKNILVTSAFHRIGTSTISISNCIFIKSAVQEVHFSWKRTYAIGQPVHLHLITLSKITCNKMTTACHWYNFVPLFFFYPQRVLVVA